MRTLKISEIESGQRLDKYLCRYMKLAPRSFIYKMLRKKNIKLNEKKASGSEMLQDRDVVTLFLAEETIDKFHKKNPPWNTDIKGELSILYENEHVVFINKPVGMLSQKAKRDDISLVEHIGSYLEKKGQLSDRDNNISIGVCNRLDRNTSGIVVAGKTLKGLQIMSELLRERKVKKYYLCIVNGRLDQAGCLKGYLYKEETKNKVKISTEQIAKSKEVLTIYEPVSFNGMYTLLKVELLTGKTHQIRAHFSSMGHPIIGDHKYGISTVNEAVKKKFGLKYQLLHCYQMGFERVPSTLSDLENTVIQTPIPSIFDKVMAGEKEAYGNVEL